MGFLPNFASICLQPTEPLTAVRQLLVLSPEVVCPQKGPLPVSGREREERWSHRLRCAGVFLVAISCQLPLNGLQMVRKRLLGTARGPVSRGRIYNRMSVYASPDWAWLPVGTEGEGEEWGKWGRGLWAAGKGCFHLCDTFPPVGPQTATVQRRAALWGCCGGRLGVEVMWWMCPAPMGSIILPHLSK